MNPIHDTDLSAVCTSHYSNDLVAAVAAAVASHRRSVLVGEGVVLSQDLDLPSGLSLHVASGAHIFIKPGITLTVSGSLDAGAYPIFNGPGRVVAGPATQTAIAHPEWWGARGEVVLASTPPAHGSADAAPGIQAAIDFFAVSGGTVRLQPVGYRCSSPIELRSGVTLAGSSLHHNQQLGSILYSLVSGSALLRGAGTGSRYADITLRDLGLHGGPGAQDGARFHQCRLRVLNVSLRNFGGTGLAISYGIASHYEQLSISHCGIGLRIAPAGRSASVSTTQTLLSSRITTCEKAGLWLQHVNSMWIGGMTYFENHSGPAVRLDDCGAITFDGCYWEGNLGHEIEAGRRGPVASLRVDNPTFIGPAQRSAQAASHDIFHLDEVSWASLDAGNVASGQRAAVVRTTSRTGTVCYRPPQQRVFVLPLRGPHSTRMRLNQGDVIEVEESSGISGGARRLRFVCVSGGVTAARRPAYVWNQGITDGTAQLVMTAERCVANFSSFMEISAQGQGHVGAQRLWLRSGLGQTRWVLRSGYHTSEEELILGEERASAVPPVITARSRMHSDRGGWMVVGGTGQQMSPSHRLTLAAATHIRPAEEDRGAALRVEQPTAGAPLLSLQGSGASASLSGAPGAPSGYLQIEINGQTRWLAVFDAPR